MAGGNNYYDLNPDGPLHWIEDGSRLKGIQLDIVGFLAILGEGSVLSNAQVAALSPITFLPRLMPAPQALLRPSRPTKLDSHTGYTTAVSAGNYRAYINHIGHMLVDSEKQPAYSVRTVRLSRKRIPDDRNEDQAPSRKTGKVKPANDQIRQKRFGPLWFVSVIGCIQSIILLIVSIYWKDAMAMMAVILLSLLSTLVGIANKWTLQLPKRQNKGDESLPPGDVVIRYAKGSFLIVQCHEDVARELYFAPEDINYMVADSWAYRSIALAGTLTLMFGVIFLGNAQTYLQLGIAGAYINMNVFYWLVAALPNKIHWDTSCFIVEEQCIAPDGESLPSRKGKKGKYVDENATFTMALWKAIVVTKDYEWAVTSSAVPSHPAWEDWMRRAKAKANEETYRIEKDVNGNNVTVWTLPEWDAQKELGQCFKAAKEQKHIEKQA